MISCAPVIPIGRAAARGSPTSSHRCDGVGSRRPPHCRTGGTSADIRWRPAVPGKAGAGEDGSVSAELVVATPLLLLLLLVAVQAGVWWHATHIAESVAAHALAAARVQDGSTAAGQASAERVLAQLADRLLTDTDVAVERTPETARVEVTGNAMPVIPGIALPVRATAAGATEPTP
jgi:hypothetical protein